MAMNAPGGDTANADICPTRDPVKPQFRLSAPSGQKIGADPDPGLSVAGRSRQRGTIA
jgi:hypothetical protein